MVQGISFKISHKSGSIVSQSVSNACFGDYSKSRERNSHYKEHILELNIPEGRLNNQGEVSVASFTKRGVLDFESQIEYLTIFQNKYFYYDFEVVEKPVKSYAGIFFNSSKFCNNEEVNNKLFKSIKVTMDLGQFDSLNEMKDALFFLRNGIYAENSLAIKFFLWLRSNVFTSNDDFTILQFSYLLSKLLSEPESEYNFFTRGYSSLNLSDKSMKIFKYTPAEKFWGDIKKSNSSAVDDFHSKFRSNYKLEYIPNMYIIADYLLAALSRNLLPEEKLVKKLIKYYNKFKENFK